MELCEDKSFAKKDKVYNEKAFQCVTFSDNLCSSGDLSNENEIN